MPTLADKLLRDYERYTGDGLPNEPVGMPLPTGDPASKMYNPPKKAFRDALNDALGGAEDATDLAEQWAENPEDDPVETGQYSALHHAAKAAASELAAAGSVADGAAILAATTAASLAAGAAIYADTTVGIAATDDGDIFMVPDGSSLIIYENDSATAVEIGRTQPKVFPDIATMAASLALIDGQVVMVDAGNNGESEHFVYDDDSALTADGALVVDATGMGAGRLISKRRDYASDAAMIADYRDYDAISEGDTLRSAGFEYTVLAAGAGSSDRVTDGGLKLDIVPARAKRVIYDHQFGNDAGALQKTTDYAIANGIGKLLLTRDHTLTQLWTINPANYNDGFHVEGYGRTCVIEQTGVGIDCVKLSEDILWQDGAMRDLHLKCDATAGHVITFGKGLDKFDGRGLQLTQANPAKHLMYANFQTIEGAATGLYRADFTAAKWELASTVGGTVAAGQVAGVYLRSDTSRINENKFVGLEARFAKDTQFFDISTVEDIDNWNDNNLFEQIDFEVCPGGGMKIGSAKCWALRGLSFWDTTLYTGNLIDFVSVSGSYDSTNNVLERVQRHGNALDTGVKDISLGPAQDTVLIACHTPAADNPAYDFNNKRVVKIGLMFGVENTLATVDLYSGGQVFPNADITATKLTLGAKTELTLASGAITVTSSRHSLDTEGDASSDDLTTINGGSDGDIVRLTAINDNRTIVVKNGAGIRLSGAADFSLDGVYCSLTLIYDGAVSQWLEVSRSDY